MECLSPRGGKLKGGSEIKTPIPAPAEAGQAFPLGEGVNK